MAQYLILIYEDESSYINPSPEVWQQAMEAHGRFAEQVVAAAGGSFDGVDCDGTNDEQGHGRKGEGGRGKAE